ncbi:DUF1918 domain-containing protein [Streptomyces sp. N2-109]|uniref:DUF1918 domain-containing protein n=1 Tax=Streptomyces gossypii TaxID=2883101 RepID=A0ABT2JN27_9ACTN|nr:DUF1918 domain-containing protein [Streptomyces gossypii]MCT2588669.1 DUF1918 domain-containing protein [Streptomyces gossypii]
MHAHKGDHLTVHGRTVGQPERDAEIVEVMGSDGEPPYRVRFTDGHETVMSPGPDSVVHEREEPDKPERKSGF